MADTPLIEGRGSSAASCSWAQTSGVAGNASRVAFSLRRPPEISNAVDAMREEDSNVFQVFPLHARPDHNTRRSLSPGCLTPGPAQSSCIAWRADVPLCSKQLEPSKCSVDAMRNLTLAADKRSQQIQSQFAHAVQNLTCNSVSPHAPPGQTLTAAAVPHKVLPQGALAAVRSPAIHRMASSMNESLKSAALPVQSPAMYTKASSIDNLSACLEAVTARVDVAERHFQQAATKLDAQLQCVFSTVTDVLPRLASLEDRLSSLISANFHTNQRTTTQPGGVAKQYVAHTSAARCLGEQEFDGQMRNADLAREASRRAEGMCIQAVKDVEERIKQLETTMLSHICSGALAVKFETEIRKRVVEARLDLECSAKEQAISDNLKMDHQLQVLRGHLEMEPSIQPLCAALEKTPLHRASQSSASPAKEMQASRATCLAGGPIELALPNLRKSVLGHDILGFNSRSPKETGLQSFSAASSAIDGVLNSRQPDKVYQSCVSNVPAECSPQDSTKPAASGDARGADTISRCEAVKEASVSMSDHSILPQQNASVTEGDMPHSAESSPLAPSYPMDSTVESASSAQSACTSARSNGADSNPERQCSAVLGTNARASCRAALGIDAHTEVSSEDPSRHEYDLDTEGTHSVSTAVQDTSLQDGSA